MRQSQFVVMGAGLSGAATAWWLATSGYEVTVVEQQPTVAGALGSSHGSARIFRYPYPSATYVQLVGRSAPLWQELEHASGQTLLTPTGGLDFGAGRDPEHLAAILQAEGVDYQLFSPSAAAGHWPQFSFDTAVLWQPDAAVIDAERAVQTMMDLATAAGAELLTSWTLDRVEQANGHYTVHSEDGDQIQAAGVIVATGGWVSQALRRLPLPSAFLQRLPEFSVTQEQAFHFPYAEGAAELAWPTFGHFTDQLEVYGLPGGRDAGFAGQKVAEFAGGKPLASAADQDGTVSPANRQRLIDYTTRHLPGLVPEPYAETTCLFTTTPSQDFLLERWEGITVVSPCSGHGAKFAPLIGALSSSIATAATPEQGRTSVPDEFLAV